MGEKDIKSKIKLRKIDRKNGRKKERRKWNGGMEKNKKKQREPGRMGERKTKRDKDRNGKRKRHYLYLLFQCHHNEHQEIDHKYGPEHGHIKCWDEGANHRQ